MQLRRAQVGDERAVAEVHVRSWQVGYRGLIADDYLDALRPEDRAGRYTFGVDDPLTIVAVTDRIRGFATISPGAGELGAFYVDPRVVGHGPGPGADHRGGAAARAAPRRRGALGARGQRPRPPLLRGGRLAPGRHRAADRVFGVAVDEVGYRKTLAAADDRVEPAPHAGRDRP